jgi:hypothetical protein
MKESHISYDGRNYVADFESESAIWEWKIGLKAMRAFREALLLATYRIVESTNKSFCLVIVDPKISTAKLEHEMNFLKSALRPDISERLELATLRKNEFELIPKNIPPSELWNVRELIETEVRPRSPLPRADRQSEVMRVLLNQWLKGNGPMTLSLLAEMAGGSYRTVDTTIKKMGSAIKRESDRRVSLKYFPVGYWARFTAISQKARGTVYYTDRSGQPRSTTSLLERFNRLEPGEIAIGGVLGAEYHYPSLDITSPPRLDLCIHAPGKYYDLGFVDLLDPGLERIDDSEEKVHVAIHFLRRKEAFFAPGNFGAGWADPIECLADLYDARLDEQASAFQAYLSGTGKQLNATSR